MAWRLKCSDAARARRAVLELPADQVDALQARISKSLDLLPNQGIKSLFRRKQCRRRARRRQQTGSHVVVGDAIQRIGLRQRRREDAFEDVCQARGPSQLRVAAIPEPPRVADGAISR